MGTEKLLIKYRDKGNTEVIHDNDFDQIELPEGAALEGYCHGTEHAQADLKT